MKLSEIVFRNFKALRDTRLLLGNFTLIVGPNGSGKSTALSAISYIGHIANRAMEINAADARKLRSVGQDSPPELEVQFDNSVPYPVRITWSTNSNSSFENQNPWTPHDPRSYARLRDFASRFLVAAFDPNMIVQAVSLNPDWVLQPNGFGLAGVLDRLRDNHPERFEALNQEWGRWLPEFDRILFDTPSQGTRAFKLRTRKGGDTIPAADLSHGTLLALTFLTLAYLPEPPTLIGVEEPDRGIHPRLLRHVQDALYRLAYPKQFGENRPPVQVVATTQSPYFLDLFRDHPEEVVIADKVGLEARFERLTDRADINDILSDAPLGEAWYSGVLGGVPSER
jgi:predicted ATPase